MEISPLGAALRGPALTVQSVPGLDAFPSFGKDKCRCEIPFCGDRDEQIGHSRPVDYILEVVINLDIWTSINIIECLDHPHVEIFLFEKVCHGLEDRFFGGKSGREILGRIVCLMRGGQLPGGEHPGGASPSPVAIRWCSIGSCLRS